MTYIMHTAEIAAPMEMSYPRKQAEIVMLGLQPQSNLHLVKVWCAEGDHTASWSIELFAWLQTIAEMRLKPKHRKLPYSFVRGALYDGPFGDQEIAATRSQLARAVRSGTAVRPVDLAAVAELFRLFHHTFATLCASGKTDDAATDALLSDLPQQPQALIEAELEARTVPTR